MKKIRFAALPILLALSLPIFATVPPPALSDGALQALSLPFYKTSARMEAMGGAGISGFSNQDAIYRNPASLANPGLVLNLPSLAITAFNFKAVNKTGVIEDLVHDRSRFDDEEYMDELSFKLLSIYSQGLNNAIGSFDCGLGAKIGGFAIAFDMKSRLVTYTPGGASSIEVIQIEDYVVSLGYGLRVFENLNFSLDIGAAARFNVRAFTTGQEERSARYFSYAVPFDIGVNFNFPLGFTFSLVAKDLNSVYRIHSSTTPLFFGTSPSLDLGFGWNYDLGFVSNIINPSIVFDVIGLDSLFQDCSFLTFLSSVRAGVEIELLRSIELRAGLDKGYPSFGLGVNIFNILHMEATYRTQEFGAKPGDHPVDALTIRFNTFWER